MSYAIRPDPRGFYHIQEATETGTAIVIGDCIHWLAPDEPTTIQTMDKLGEIYLSIRTTAADCAERDRIRTYQTWVQRVMADGSSVSHAARRRAIYARMGWADDGG